MIASSADFSAAVARESRTFDAKILHSGTEIDTVIRRLVIHKGSCGTSGFIPGAVFSPYIEMILDSCGTAIEGKELELMIGVKTSGTLASPVFDYIRMGFFTVGKPKTSTHQITCTAYGRIQTLLSEKFYFNAIVGMPTIADVVSRIQTLTGVTVEVESGIDTSVPLNSDFLVRSFTAGTGVNCREALSAAAFASGGFATETADGKIRICRFSVAVTEEFTADSVMTVLPEFHDYDTEITGVQVLVSDDLTYTSGTPVNLKVNNAYISEEAFLANIVPNLIGLTYRGGEVSLALGDPRLEPWDAIRITDIEENSYILPCMALTFVYDGGMQTVCTAPSIEAGESTLDTLERELADARKAAAAAQESIDNLGIGGRNLLRMSSMSSQDASIVNNNTNFTEYFRRYNGNTSQHTFEKIADGVYQDTVALNTSGNLGVAFARLVSEFNFDYSSEYTLSCWAKCTKENTHLDIGLSYYKTDDTWVWRSGTNPQNFKEINKWQFFKLTFKPDADTKAICYCFTVKGETNGTDSFSIRNCKLERGNNPTDWSPAPEDLEASLDGLAPELIVGTHGTTATATWTGTSTVLTELKTGTRIQYKLSSAGASNVTLNLTLKNGTTTGAKPVYFLNTTRLGTQYGINATIDLIYDGDAWRVLNPYKNDNTVGTYGGAVTAGSNGVQTYSLVMRDTETTWVSLTTSGGTGTAKQRYTGGLYPDHVMYMGSNSTYAAGATTGNCYEALGVNLNYSTNSGSHLTARKPVYLVGEIHSDGLFYLDPTWWTQTEPTTEDGKTYIYLGLAYSTSNVYLVADNTLYQYSEGKFRTLAEIEQRKAARTATNYLARDNTGLMVADMAGGTQYTPSTVPTGVKNTFIDSDSFDVRDGQKVLASFGESSQVGSDDGNHFCIDGEGIRGANEKGVVVFDVRTNGSVQPAYERTEESTSMAPIHVDMSTMQCSFQFPHIPATASPDVRMGWYAKIKITYSGGTFIRDYVAGYCRGEEITTETYSDEYYEWTYTGTPAALSQSGENECYVSATFRSESLQNITDIEISDFRVDYFIYVGDTEAPTFTLGTRDSDEKGDYSCTIGKMLTAKYEEQFACGRYNNCDSDYAFMVGNGTPNRASNAFAVTTDGDPIFGIETQGNIYHALVALGWASSVLTSDIKVDGWKLIKKILEFLTPQNETYTAYGLLIIVYRIGKIVDLYISGQVSSELSTANRYCELFRGVPIPLQDCVNRMPFNNSTIGQMRINTDGTLNLGYTINLSGTAVNVPANTSLYLHTTYGSR